MSSDLPENETAKLPPPEYDAELEPDADSPAARPADLGSNAYLRAMLDDNFLEYASYVIKDRAIPDVDDGLKPVQRRILWALHRIDDGKTHKVANVIGDTMKFHPHGDASIGDALVVLANKEYFIHRQGNYGNIFTGHPAAAARYIECSLSDLGREVLFNDDITEFVDSYDGRNREPAVLPVKIPALLLLGAYGIAVGMRTQIMPHNFNELLRAQIAQLRGEEFELYPDFLQGGTVDVSEYNDGNGKINLRARIDIEGRRLIIREIPATVTTESLIASIEKAAEKGKIKIASINDYTSEQVEIEIIPTRGYEPDKALRALYMYTDCSVSISVNLMVICENRPREMSIHEVVARNTEKLLDYLRRELEIELGKLEDQFHAKTLAQIFIENRIYKRIEECKTEEAVYTEVHAGLAPFRHLVRRDITDDDVAKLLVIQIGRISRFSIEKNQKELQDILAAIEAANRNLRHLRQWAIRYLENLLEKYGAQFPRRTAISRGFEKIDRRAAALNNIRIGHDRKNGYLGTAVKSEDVIICNEFDLLLTVEKNGTYKITDLPPEKLFIGKVYDCRRHDPAVEFAIVYREQKTGKCYGKRSKIGSFIKDREYNLCPEGCRIELFTPRPDAVYTIACGAGKKGNRTEELNLMTLPGRSAKARGVLLKAKNIRKFTHLRYLDEAELAALKLTEEQAPEDEAAETVVHETGPAAVEAVEVEPAAAPEEPAPVADPMPEPKPESAPAARKRKKNAPSDPQPEPAPLPATVEAPPEIEPVSLTSAVPESEPAAESGELMAIEVEVAKAKPKREKKPRPPRPKQPAESAPVEPVVAPPSPAGDEAGGDDEFGIVQPEFGF